MADIFLSYSHLDRARAVALVAALSDRFSVWWDPDLDAAGTWRKDLEEQIDSARCVVVLWSEAARDSDFVRSEASRAAQRKTLLQAASQRSAKCLLSREASSPATISTPPRCAGK